MVEIGAQRSRVAAAVMVVTLLGCEAPDTSGGTSVPSIASSTDVPGRVVELSLETGEILRDLQVGHDPLLAVPAQGSIWTADLDDAGVTRVDTSTGAITHPPAGEVAAIASDGSDVWVASDGNQLRLLDGVTGEERRSFALADRPLFEPRDAGFLVMAAGSLWMTVPASLGDPGPQSLWRIGPTTGSVLATIPIGPNPLPPVAAAGAIWMSTEDFKVTRVDTGTERVRTLDLGPFPGPITHGGGRVWASAEGTVYGLDPSTGRRLSSFDLGVGPRGLSWAGGALWIATATDVLVVDPAEGRVIRSVELSPPSDDEGPIVVMPVDDSVWVSIETR